MRACAPPCSWVYFSTSISPIRYRSFANNCAASAFDYCTTSSTLSRSLFFTLSVPRCLPSSLSRIYRPLDAVIYVYLVSALPLPPPFPISIAKTPSSLSLSRPFFSTFSLPLSFLVPLLISLDRIDLLMCARPQ